MTPQAKSYGNSLFLTVLLVGLYWGLRHIPLSTATGYLDLLPEKRAALTSRFNVATLGLVPVISGFLCLEILSFLVKPLARWRLEGVVGREKLNRWAWALGLLFTFIQALWTSYLLLNRIQSNPLLSPVGHLGPFQLVTMASLMGGTFCCVWIARLITQYGVGNGFLVLVFSLEVESLFQGLAWRLYQFQTGDHSRNGWLVFDLTAFLTAMTCLWLWKLIRKPPRIPVKRPNGKIIRYEISPFPVPAQTQHAVITLLSSVSAVLAAKGVDNLWWKNGWSHLGWECLLTALLGFAFYQWIFSDIDLFGLAVEDLAHFVRKRESLLDRQFKISMAFLLAASCLFWFPFGGSFGFLSEIVQLTVLIKIFAISQDILSQWEFWRVHGPGMELLEMDNVHLASYLKGLFEAENIPVCVQAYHYRRLMYFLTPLYKMRLLVPEEKAGRAREILGTVRFKVV